MTSRRDFLQKIGAAYAIPSMLNQIQAQPVYDGKKLRVALCGLGNYAKLIAKGIEGSQYCTIAGIVTGTPSKAAEWKKKYNLADKDIYDYKNFDKIAENKDIDAVYVILPNSMHAEFTIRAAKAGKHVICEKPMANTDKECEEMIAACKKANVELGIGYRCHFEPFNMEIMRFGREKTFGKIRYINSDFGFRIGDPTQWRLKKAFAGGGPLMDVGVYCIQACRYITGEEPISVSAQFGPVTDLTRFAEVEESISWQFEFPGGVVTNSFSSYKTNIEHLIVKCDEGWFETSPSFSYGPLKGRTSKGEMNLPVVYHQTYQMDGIGKAFVETSKFPSHISGEEGLRDVRLLNKIYESAANGGKKLML
jgi:predicted dehydrogenase